MECLMLHTLHSSLGWPLLSFHARFTRKSNLQPRRWLSFWATRPNNRDILRPGRMITNNAAIGQNSDEEHSRQKKKRQRSEQRFVDRIHLKAQGGSGGAGCLAYHRMGPYKKRPCGGHGGRGGSVYLVTDPTMSSLRMERHHYSGQDGGRGGTSGMNGKNGKDVYVRVPCGVVVRRVMDWEEVEIYAEDDGDGGGEGTGMPEVQALEKDSYDANGRTNAISLHHTKEHGEHLETSSHVLDRHIMKCHDEESRINEDNFDNEEEDSHGKDEDNEDFDTYFEGLSKRQRKHLKRPDGLPLDYDQVVDQGVRSEDGMFYWSNSSDEEDGQLTFAANDRFQNGVPRKTTLLADLNMPNTSLLVAAGGKPGVGNIAYANRPYYSNMETEAARKKNPGRGESVHLELELKLIADIGLVGFPNAGKSSLLSAMSRARPKIASYPFTTLSPLVGSIQYRDGYSIALADVPGLIDGAARGRGKGIEFLRHIERTKALAYMVDGVGVDGRDPVSDLKILGKELREYGSSGIFGENEMGADKGVYGEEMRKRRREIMNRPSLILANKMDLIPEEDIRMGRRDELLLKLGQAAGEVGIVCENDNVIGISAGVTGEGLRVLSERLRQVIKQAEQL